MFKNLRISVKLYVLIGIILFGLAIIGIVSYMQSRAAEKMIVTMVDRELELLVDLNGLYATGLQTEQATRNVLINPR